MIPMRQLSRNVFSSHSVYHLNAFTCRKKLQIPLMVSRTLNVSNSACIHSQKSHFGTEKTNQTDISDTINLTNNTAISDMIGKTNAMQTASVNDGELKSEVTLDLRLPLVESNRDLANIPSFVMKELSQKHDKFAPHPHFESTMETPIKRMDTPSKGRIAASESISNYRKEYVTKSTNHGNESLGDNINVQRVTLSGNSEKQNNFEQDVDQDWAETIPSHSHTIENGAEKYLDDPFEIGTNIISKIERRKQHIYLEQIIDLLLKKVHDKTITKDEADDCILQTLEILKKNFSWTSRDAQKYYTYLV